MRYFLIAFALLLIGCERSNVREFQTRGIVRGISPDRRTLDVQHEAIPNYMPSMTMPFVLKEPRDAAQLNLGDGIAFRLVVNDKEAVIDHVRKIPAREVEVPPLAEATPSSSSPRLREGDALPVFSLTNQNSETITPETFHGQPLVLTFVFTRCPVPNFCPLMSKNFAQLQEAIRGAGENSLGKTKLLSISFDPEHDSPAVLREYAQSQHADFALWTFATGAQPEIDSLTKAFAVMIQPESGTITHGLATALIDANGRVVEIWRGNGWKPEEVIAKINSL